MGNKLKELNYIPVYLFLPYIGYYAAQSLFGTYLNLYLNDLNFTKTQMGMITSLSTLMVLLVQPLWGIASDRARNKVNVIRLILFLNAVSILGFYISRNFYFVLLIDIIFCMFYNPALPLIDNVTLEILEMKKTSCNFGHIRLGGTVGYAVGVLVAGRLMNNNYQKMFYMISLLMLVALIGFPRSTIVKGYSRDASKMPLKKLFQDKRIFPFIMMFVINCLCLVIFYSYYPLYFTEIGGNSSMVGILMFVTAISEMPCWLISGRLLKKIGYKNMMILSGAAGALRWILLFFVTNPILAITVNVLHGFSFVTLNYSLITFINENIAKELRATGQTLNNMVGTIVSRVIGGVVVGYLSDILGIKSMLLVSAIASVVSIIIFIGWYTAAERRNTQVSGSVISETK